MPCVVKFSPTNLQQKIVWDLASNSFIPSGPSLAVKNIPAKIVYVMKPIGMKVEEDIIFSGQPMPYYKDLHIQCVSTAYPITHYDKKEDKT